MKLAIYDFDGTLLNAETLPFIVKYWQSHGYSKMKLFKFYTNVIKLTIIYKLKLNPSLDKEKYRAEASKIFMFLFEGMTKKEIVLFFSNCATELINHFNTEIVASIHEKKDEGYHIVICSGANTLLLNEAVNHLPIDTLIGTELIFLDDNTYDYEAPIVMITGENKPKALLDAFSGQNIDWNASYAFGDSYYDHDILNLTGNPVAVNPDKRLREVANKKDWKIIYCK